MRLLSQAFMIVKGSNNSEIFKSFLDNDLAAALLPDGWSLR
jgi:hypothetical protein